MDKTDACYVRCFMDNDKVFDESYIVSIEAMFEQNPFDPNSQQAFEDVLNNE